MNTLVTWLSVNSVDAEVKEEFLRTLDFDHFTIKELASDVRKSELYSADKIIERMENLFENKNREFETLSQGFLDLNADANKTREERDQLERDMKTMKRNLKHYNLWSYIDADVRYRYNN